MGPNESEMAKINSSKPSPVMEQIKKFRTLKQSIKTIKYCDLSSRECQGQPKGHGFYC